MTEVTDSILFRQKIYQNFKENGILDKLKTTLRTNLLQKLQKPSLRQQQKSVLQQDKSKPFHLKKKFIDCILQEHLKKKHMEYTLSIFMPQTMLDSQDCLSFNELSQVTNLPYKATDMTFIQTLVDEWVRLKSCEVRQRSIQTQDSFPVGKKLQQIEIQYLAKIDYWKLIPNKKLSQVSPSLYQHQQKLRLEFQTEKNKIKMDLQRSIKTQMERKFQNQYLFRMKQVTKQHQKRLEELKHRQKTLFQSMEKKKRQIQEKAKQLSDKQFQMISKYQNRERELKSFYMSRQADIQKKQKQFWKKELQLKAKKRQYEDTIRLVKQKVIKQAGEMQT